MKWTMQGPYRDTQITCIDIHKHNVQHIQKLLCTHCINYVKKQTQNTKRHKHTFTLKTDTHTHTEYQHYSSVVFTEYHNMYMYITNLMSYKFS